ncbi:hypothetical protein EBU71_11335 [bacterium]|nr:hypothetical protein [Candidatus Elulimicrobium humile]
METWNLSVAKWREIITILKSLRTPTNTSFATLKGLNKTRVYNNAILLSRHKISPHHRRIVVNTIRKISNNCRGFDDTIIISILIPRTLCNLIRSNSIPR